MEMMDERGLDIAHAMILRWVQRDVPEFEKQWSRDAQARVGSSDRRMKSVCKTLGRFVSAICTGTLFVTFTSLTHPDFRNPPRVYA